MPVTGIVQYLDCVYLDMNSKNCVLKYNIISYMKWSIYDVHKLLLFNVYVLFNKKPPMQQNVAFYFKWTLDNGRTSLLYPNKYFCAGILEQSM